MTATLARVSAWVWARRWLGAALLLVLGLCAECEANNHRPWW